MDEIVAALADQQHELSGILAGLDDGEWKRPTRCDGWDVSDVVLHLAQTNELALGSASGSYDEVLGRLTAGLAPATSVDDSVAGMVDGERGGTPAVLLERWSLGASRVIAAFDQGDLSQRVRWVAGTLSLRTLATTRLAETWIHTGDVAGAVGAELPATDRLRYIARLAWRTLPYAFSSVDSALAGPVAFHLVSPSGAPWDFVPDTPPVTRISGPAAELCAVAARRVEPSVTSLRGEGPDAEAVLALVRTYA